MAAIKTLDLMLRCFLSLTALSIHAEIQFKCQIFCINSEVVAPRDIQFHDNKFKMDLSL